MTIRFPARAVTRVRYGGKVYRGQASEHRPGTIILASSLTAERPHYDPLAVAGESGEMPVRLGQGHDLVAHPPKEDSVTDKRRGVPSSSAAVAQSAVEWPLRKPWVVADGVQVPRSLGMGTANHGLNFAARSVDRVNFLSREPRKWSHSRTV